MSGYIINNALNLRDIASINTKLLREKTIYRSCTFSQNLKENADLLKSLNIQSILDLRRKKEVDKFPYDLSQLKLINHNIEYYNIALLENTDQFNAKTQLKYVNYDRDRRSNIIIL